MNGIFLNTDPDWYDFLRRPASLDEVDFWQPNGGRRVGVGAGNSGRSDPEILAERESVPVLRREPNVPDATRGAPPKPPAVPTPQPPKRHASPKFQGQ